MLTELLWSWRWSPLSFFLSALRLSLGAPSRSRRSGFWLSCRLSALPWFSSTARFAWTWTSRRSAYRPIDSRLASLFSASRFARPCTSRWRARLPLLGTPATFMCTRAGWRRCPTALRPGGFTATLLWSVCRAPSLPRSWCRTEPALWLTLSRWWRRWTE